MRRSMHVAAAAAAAFSMWFGQAAALPGHASSDVAVDAFRKAESAYEGAWDRAPMSARRVYFVTGPVKQHGSYEPRGDNAFKASEKVITYIEPVGFAFRDLGNGVLAYGFKVALKVRRPDGSLLLDKPDVARLDSRTRSRKHDVEFTSSLDIETLPAGTYTLDFTFHDLYSDKQMAVGQTFRVLGSSPTPDTHR